MWNKKINIHGFLDSFSDGELTRQEMLHSISTSLRRHIPDSEDVREQDWEMFDELKAICDDFASAGADIEMSQSDDLLRWMYAWADFNKVWLGP